MSTLREAYTTVKDLATIGAKSQFKRVVVIGPRKVAKTTSLGCLELACDLKSLRDKNFKHFTDEKSSGLCQIPSDLCAGYFPEQTPSGLLYEADKYLTWKRMFGSKTVVLPFMETSGEDIENLAGPYSESIYRQATSWQDADILNKTICDSNGYILVLAVNHARISFVPEEFLYLEESNVRNDPDLTLRRVLNAIYKHKKLYPKSPPIEGIAVLLTKYDAIQDFVKSRNMDLEDPEGAQRFLATYFRQTMGMLKYYGLEKVKFFPVFVNVEKVKKPDGKLAFARHADGTFKIALNYQRHLPLFSEQMYYNLIDWIEKTFAG